METEEIESFNPHEIIAGKIVTIRGQRVMLDFDLAELYGVETKRLKEQVKRNSSRFPAQYMFELTEREINTLRSQNATSKLIRGGNRYVPMVFTEHGVLQLANVLKSKRAETVSFLIIDVFVKYRKMLYDTTEIRLELEKVIAKVDKHTTSIDLAYEYLYALGEKLKKPPIRTAVGFKIPKKSKS